MPENKLREFRKRKKLSQKQLAEKCGVTNDYISIIERGKQSPGFKLAKLIADILDSTVDTIFFDYPSNKTFDNSRKVG